MIDENQARALALASSILREGMRLGEAHELREGWHFPLRSTGMMAGCNGVIVNKETGKLFHLGSAFPPERDLELYDRGYQFETYDLVILDVRDRKQTLHALSRLRLNLDEPRLEHGVVWQIPRRMTNAEIGEKLDHLPCTLPAIGLYFDIELLEKARQTQWFTFEAREHTPPISPTTAT